MLVSLIQDRKLRSGKFWQLTNVVVAEHLDLIAMLVKQPTQFGKTGFSKLIVVGTLGSHRLDGMVVLRQFRSQAISGKKVRYRAKRSQFSRRPVAVGVLFLDFS